MYLIKKISVLYQYIYYRLFLYQEKQLKGNKSLAVGFSNFALTLNAGSLLFSIDIILQDYTEICFFDNNIYYLVFIFVIILVIQSIVLRKSIEHYEKKFKNEENRKYWKAKGIIVLLFVYGPIFLLVFLM